MYATTSADIEQKVFVAACEKLVFGNDFPGLATHFEVDEADGSFRN